MHQAVNPSVLAREFNEKDVFCDVMSNEYQRASEERVWTHFSTRII